MRFYFEEMADAIDLKKEDTRIAAIKFDAAPLVGAWRNRSSRRRRRPCFRLPARRWKRPKSSS